METTNARYEKKNSQMETGITFASYVHSRGKGFLLGELEDGVGSKRILLFQCHAHEERCRERLQILRYFNPALPIHFLYGGDAKDAPKFHALAGEFGAGFWEYSVKGRNGRWKWKHYDLVLREWYRQYGKNLDFTHLYSYEWDVLTAAPLHLIFPRLNTNAVYLTPVRAFTKKFEEEWWWTRNGRWKKTALQKYLGTHYGVSRPHFATLGAGMILPKAFFVSFAQIPELLGVNAEASIPALAEAFGFSLRDTRIFTSPRNAGKRFWNTTEVRLEDLQGELGIKHGLKMFHPVKCQVTLDNLLEWTKNLLTTSDQKSIIN